MKLNNKGFAVSAILYSLLLAFVLFMLVVIVSFNNSADIISAANDDIVNGNKLITNQIKTAGTCNDGKTWYTSPVTKKILIKTSHNSYYWPKDFAYDSSSKKWISNKTNGEKISIGFTTGNKFACDNAGATYSVEDVGGSGILASPNSGEFYCAHILDALTNEYKNLHLVDMCNN